MSDPQPNVGKPEICAWLQNLATRADCEPYGFAKDWTAGQVLRYVRAAIADGRVHVELETPCTGVSATWCPNCGDCSCPREEDGTFIDGQNHPECPLHATDSPHAEGFTE